MKYLLEVLLGFIFIWLIAFSITLGGLTALSIFGIV